MRTRRIAFGFAAVIASTQHGIAADRELGQYLASECVTCHRPVAGAGGVPSSDGGVPGAAGIGGSAG